MLENVDHLVHEPNVDLISRNPEELARSASATPVAEGAPEHNSAAREAQTLTAAVATGQAAVTDSAADEPRFPTEGIFAPHNALAREAVVNIFCSRTTGRTTRTTTGSGIIIDSRGVILTNAHVAELFALSDESKAGKPACTIRTGTPARDTYEAELLYLPENWVRTFAPELGEPNPTGTGEEDFALLLITDTTSDATDLPDTFPFVPVSEEPLAVQRGEQVLIVSYPAIVSSLSSIRRELFLVSTLSHITRLFTFDRTTLDLFSLDGNIAATQGSSGGAVINSGGRVVGIVVTSSKGDFTLERELRALTVAHMNRKMADELNATLGEFLQGDVRQQARQFQRDQMPELANLLLRR